jgi:hypothetical protein
LNGSIYNTVAETACCDLSNADIWLGKYCRRIRVIRVTADVRPHLNERDDCTETGLKRQ